MKKIVYFIKKIPKNFLLSLILFIFSLFLLQTENQRIEKRVLGLQTQLKMDQQAISYWEQILAERPSYRDGWVHLAAVHYKLGQRQKAKEALQKAKALDPNNEIILNFEKLIGN